MVTDFLQYKNSLSQNIKTSSGLFLTSFNCGLCHNMVLCKLDRIMEHIWLNVNLQNNAAELRKLIGTDEDNKDIFHISHCLFPQGVNVQLCYWGLRSFYSHISLLTHDYCKMQWIRWKWYHYWNARFLSPHSSVCCVIAYSTYLWLSCWNSFSFIWHPAIEPDMRNVSNSHHFRLSVFFTHLQSKISPDEKAHHAQKWIIAGWGN